MPNSAGLIVPGAGARKFKISARGMRRVPPTNGASAYGLRVGTCVGVNVAVGVCVNVRVGVDEGVAVKVRVCVGVRVNVAVGFKVDAAVSLNARAATCTVGGGTGGSTLVCNVQAVKSKNVTSANGFMRKTILLRSDAGRGLCVGRRQKIIAR